MPTDLLIFLPQALAVLLAADFMSGIVHWVEDVYADESMPLIGRHVARTNIIHHHFPRHFTRLTWWQSSWLLCSLATVFLFAAWGLGVLTWHAWLFALLGANANQIHKWAHRTPAENGPVITFLQRIRLFQTPHHHARHHTDPKDCHYCTISNLLNPLLDRLDFWGSLELGVTRATGLPRRRDTSVHGQGPGPAWLNEYRPRHARAASVQACHPPAATLPQPRRATAPARPRNPRCGHASEPPKGVTSGPSDEPTASLPLLRP